MKFLWEQDMVKSSDFLNRSVTRLIFLIALIVRLIFFNRGFNYIFCLLHFSVYLCFICTSSVHCCWTL